MNESASSDLVPTKYAFIGEVSANLIKAPMQLFVLWMATLTPLIHGRRFWALVGLTLMGTVFATVLSFCASRTFEVHAGRSSPGGWGYALVPTILEPVGGFLGGWAITQDFRIAVVEGIVFALVAIGFFLLGKPWEPGPMSAEVHAKIQETTEMTKEHFADDVEKISADSRRINKARWERHQAKRRRGEK